MRKRSLLRWPALLLMGGVAGAGAAQTVSPPPPQGDRAPARSCSGNACGSGDLVFFGTRADGPGTGIAAARFDPATGTLAPLGIAGAATHPTWLLVSPHRPILYAVKEVGNDGSAEGGVLSFAVDGASGRLSPISAVGSGGGGATFLTIDGRATPPAILVANYGTGEVSVIPLGPRGVLGAVASRQRDVGSGPSPRQKSAHPHGIAIDPAGRHALVADLGADRVFVYRYDAAHHSLAPAETASVAVPPASGLRHIVFHPNGRFAFANAEFTGDVLVFGWDATAARLTLLRTVPTRAPGYAGELSSAEIAVSPDGRFLYLSNRGADELLVFAVDAGTGDLAPVQRLASGGKAPASFAFDRTGRWMLVADEGSNLVAVFARDPASGRLTSTGSGLTVADPTSVAFLAR